MRESDVRLTLMWTEKNGLWRLEPPSISSPWEAVWQIGASHLKLQRDTPSFMNGIYELGI